MQKQLRNQDCYSAETEFFYCKEREFATAFLVSKWLGCLCVSLFFIFLLTALNQVASNSARV
jgi:hypothetical protein